MTLPFSLQQPGGVLPRIKICGLSTPITVAAAVDGGADFIGFVSFARSPRHVTLAQAAALAAPVRNRTAIVLLLVDADDASVDAAVRELAPDILQLHGSETPSRVQAVRARSGLPVIKAIKVETSADIATADTYRDIADLVLFDAKAPKSLAGGLPGGNGLSFDWQLLDGVAARLPFMLSGGLDPGNVATAIAVTRALFIDVSSSVESAPGRKDVALINAFIAAAHAAAASPPKRD